MKHALVVDDTAVDRRLAGGLIEQGNAIQVSYAKNGVDAMEQIQLCPPDIVVTDMQMPEMGGLELVTKVRANFPAVPVILMTAQGSEAIAVEALERGASGYVPKSQLNDRLRSTVEDVLMIAQADQTVSKLIRCQESAEMSFKLENDPTLIDALVDLSQKMMDGMQLTDHTGRTRAAVAVREALRNAMYHGNLEITSEEIEASREAMMTGSMVDPVAEKAKQAPYADRRVHVDVRLRSDEARFVIEDEGNGFNYAEQLTKVDPSALESTGNGRGRGFVLMLSFMDEVSFNETGNRVTLVKQRDNSQVDPQ